MCSRRFKASGAIYIGKMGLNIIKKGAEKFYDIIGNASISFQYANDLMHAGFIGAAPILVGKYSSELLGRKIPFFEKHSTKIGYASAALAEGIWRFKIEPSSPYDHPEDTFSDNKGSLETGLGALVAHLTTNFLSRKKRAV